MHSICIPISYYFIYNVHGLVICKDCYECATCVFIGTFYPLLDLLSAEQVIQIDNAYKHQK